MSFGSSSRPGNDGLNWPHCDGLNWPHLPSERDWTVRAFSEHGSEVAEGMGSRVELFERIRRDRESEGLSIRALARRHGVHRRAVRQALESAVPPERKRRPVSRPAPALGPFRELIDAWLLADRTRRASSGIRPSAFMIGLRDEYGVVVAESTVRDYVRRRRRELGLAAEAFCPQVHDPGVTAEVDWGEAKVLLGGVLVEVGLFLMRACFSGACFVMAFESQSQQAFFEGHVAAFEFFSGVFATSAMTI